MARIAVLADIHGNLPAFEAALKHVSQQKVDQVILAGDIVNGSPDSKACWSLALSLGCPILRGNHERYAAHFGTAKASPLWTTEQFAPLQWTVEQLSEEDRQCMEQLPFSLRLPEAPDLFLSTQLSGTIITRSQPTRQNPSYTICFRRHKSGIFSALITTVGRRAPGKKGSLLPAARWAYPWTAIRRRSTCYLTRRKADGKFNINPCPIL